MTREVVSCCFYMVTTVYNCSTRLLFSCLYWRSKFRTAEHQEGTKADGIVKSD